MTPADDEHERQRDPARSRGAGGRAGPAAPAWHITRGEPAPEEVAAVAVALAAVLAARAAGAGDRTRAEARGAARREAARRRDAAARRAAAASWAVGDRPGWRRGTR